MSDIDALSQHADAALEAGEAVVAGASKHLAALAAVDGRISNAKLDEHQIAAFDHAYNTAEITAAREVLRDAKERGGDLEKRLALLFLAESLASIRGRILARPSEYGISGDPFAEQSVTEFLAANLAPAVYEAIADILADTPRGPDQGLEGDHVAMRDTFRRFAEEVVQPLAEHIHREDLLVPKQILEGLTEMGCFGLSIPQAYDGFQDDEHPDNMGMIVVTEELSRGSLASAGSLITRPEILGKALLKGGTDEQKQKWLPKLASGEAMATVAVTEPDFGSDVAGIQVAATRTEGGWKINGVKTWCTFAGYGDTIMVLARTDPDASKKHRGLSLFIAEKPRFEGHAFEYQQPEGGKIEGRAIPTIGYRGMHSYEVNFEDYFVPEENLVGGEAGLGRGFYLQMEGFAGGRLQTAARALGVMQAAFEEGLRYAQERSIFGKPVFEYGLTKYKLAKMASVLHATRRFTYLAARLADDADGAMECSLVKLYACKTAEWVTREAMQIHGGMGYAEEFPVSRYFLDARVLSIFEGAEEVLALRVVARSVLDRALAEA